MDRGFADDPDLALNQMDEVDIKWVDHNAPGQCDSNDKREEAKKENFLHVLRPLSGELGPNREFQTSQSSQVIGEITSFDETGFQKESFAV